MEFRFNVVFFELLLNRLPFVVKHTLELGTFCAEVLRGFLCVVGAFFRVLHLLLGGCFLRFLRGRRMLQGAANGTGLTVFQFVGKYTRLLAQERGVHFVVFVGKILRDDDRLVTGCLCLFQSGGFFCIAVNSELDGFERRPLFIRFCPLSFAPEFFLRRAFERDFFRFEFFDMLLFGGQFFFEFFSLSRKCLYLTFKHLE